MKWYSTPEDRIKHYAELLEAQIEAGMLEMDPDEEIKHCTERVLFGGDFFLPEWACTSKGRVWSIARKKWIAPQPSYLKSSLCYYWRYKSNGHTIYAHCLIACYFCDKTALLIYPGALFEVHHIYSYGAFPASLMTCCAENRDARIASTMARDNAANLRYELKSDHKSFLHKIMDGEEIKYCLDTGEKDDTVKSVFISAPNNAAEGLMKKLGAGPVIEYSLSDSGEPTKEFKLVAPTHPNPRVLYDAQKHVLIDRATGETKDARTIKTWHLPSVENTSNMQ